MKEINNGSLHNSNVLLVTNDNVNILSSERAELERARDFTNWIKTPNKQDRDALDGLIERYNIKINELLNKT